MDPLKIKDINPTKAAFSLYEEFKNFSFKGNVIDLAVGVIIGGAFAKIVDSLVKSIIMPLIGTLMPGDKSYESWAWVINGQTIPYGQFLAEVINFLIVAAALFFFVVKFLGWVLKYKKQEKAGPPPLSKDQELLSEIRDILKKERAL